MKDGKRVPGTTDSRCSSISREGCCVSVAVILKLNQRKAARCRTCRPTQSRGGPRRWRRFPPGSYQSAWGHSTVSLTLDDSSRAIPSVEAEASRNQALVTNQGNSIATGGMDRSFLVE